MSTKNKTNETEKYTILQEKLYPNIKLATSHKGVFSGTYSGLLTFLYLLNHKKNEKITYDSKIFNKSLSALKSPYKIKSFTSYLLKSIDSNPIPIIFNTNLQNKVYDKEGNIYANYYIAIKSERKLDINHKYLPYYDKKMKILKIENNNKGISISPVVGRPTIITPLLLSIAISRTF